jgi:hypothetical protein
MQSSTNMLNHVLPDINPEGLDGGLAGYHSLTVWQVALERRKWAQNFGIFADRFKLVLPDVDRLNNTFDKVRASGNYSPGPRFKATPKDEEYTAEEFVKNLAMGKVLLAYRGKFFIHDNLDDHLIGSFAISERQFNRVVQRARFMEEIRVTPELIRHPAVVKEIRALYTSMAVHWDAITGRLGLLMSFGPGLDLRVHTALLVLAGRADPKVNFIFNDKYIVSALDSVENLIPALETSVENLEVSQSEKQSLKKLLIQITSTYDLEPISEEEIIHDQAILERSLGIQSPL